MLLARVGLAGVVFSSLRDCGACQQESRGLDIGNDGEDRCARGRRVEEECSAGTRMEQASKKKGLGGKSWGWRRSWVRAGWVWGGGGQLCGAAAEDGDPWTPHWARCLAQKWDSGRNDRRNGSAPAPCHSRASCPSSPAGLPPTRRGCGLTPSPSPSIPPPIAIPPPTHPGSPGPLQLASPPPVQHPAICGRVDVSIGLGLDNDIHADSATFDLARSWSVPASYSATPHPIPLQPFFTVPRRRVWRRRPGPRTAAMGAHQIAQRRAVQTTAAKARQDGPDRNTHSHWWAAR